EDSPVQPGETIRVTLTWDTADWSASQLHKVLDCVAVDGQLVRSLQDGESPTDNDGRFTREFSVPDDVRPGTRVCDQAMLSGHSPRADYDRQISNEVCHTVERSTARRGGGCGKCGNPCGKKDEGAGCGPKKEGGGCRQSDGCAKPGDCNKDRGCKKGGGEKTCGDKKENENGDAGGCATGGGTCDKEDGSGCTKSECGKQKEG